MKSNAELSLIFLVSAAPYKALYEAIRLNQSPYKAPLTRKIRLKSEMRRLYSKCFCNLGWAVHLVSQSIW